MLIKEFEHIFDRLFRKKSNSFHWILVREHQIYLTSPGSVKRSSGLPIKTVTCKQILLQAKIQRFPSVGEAVPAPKANACLSFITRGYFESYICFFFCLLLNSTISTMTNIARSTVTPTGTPMRTPSRDAAVVVGTGGVVMGISKCHKFVD